MNTSRKGIVFHTDILAGIAKELDIRSSKLNGMYDFFVDEISRVCHYSPAIGFRISGFGYLYLRESTNSMLAGRAARVGDLRASVDCLQRIPYFNLARAEGLLLNDRGYTYRAFPSHLRKPRYLRYSFNEGQDLAQVYLKQNIKK